MSDDGLIRRPSARILVLDGLGAALVRRLASGEPVTQPVRLPWHHQG